MDEAQLKIRRKIVDRLIELTAIGVLMWKNDNGAWTIQRNFIQYTIRYRGDRETKPEPIHISIINNNKSEPIVHCIDDPSLVKDLHDAVRAQISRREAHRESQQQAQRAREEMESLLEIKKMLEQ